LEDEELRRLERLSTPSLGITSQQMENEESAEDAISPFNSLSRDHSSWDGRC